MVLGHVGQSDVWRKEEKSHYRKERRTKNNDNTAQKICLDERPNCMEENYVFYKYPHTCSHGLRWEEEPSGFIFNFPPKFKVHFDPEAHPKVNVLCHYLNDRGLLR